MIRFIDDIHSYEPKDEYSFLVKNYFEDIIRDGSKKFIQNIDVDIKILEINERLIPITFGNNYENQCFSVSVLGMFSYLYDESQKSVENLFLKKFLWFFSKNIYKIMKISGTYKAIFVNNFLLSTNFFPQLSCQEIWELRNFLTNTYPDFSIIFRSVNEFEEQALCDFEKNNFKKIIFRQVYVGYKNLVEKYQKIKEVKSDKNLLKRSQLQQITSKNFSQNEIREIVECYANLYIKKYSNKNPILTENFIKNILKNNIFSLWILKNEKSEIIATYGYYQAFWQIASPIFGYKDGAYYRHLTSFFFQEAMNRCEILNWSSGVGEFKMHRWNEMKIEYFCAYYAHLDWKNRCIWFLVSFFSKYLWEPYFKKYII